MADTKQRHKVDGEEGHHRDGDKPRIVDMLPAGLVLEAGRIWAQNNAPRDGYPNGKYPDFPNGVSNFKGGIRLTKYLDSIMRHLLALINCEDVDQDSGFDHAGHILCNLAMFWWTRRNRSDLDDRDAMPPGKIAAQPTSGGRGSVTITSCTEYELGRYGCSFIPWYEDKIGTIYSVRINDPKRDGGLGWAYRILDGPDKGSTIQGCDCKVIDWYYDA